MTIKTFLKICGALFLAATITVVAAAIIVPRLLDLENYRTRIVSTAQSALNRRVAYKSAAISWQLTPAIVLEEITIAEKTGENSFLEVGRLTLKLALLPLLRKEIFLREIVVERPRLMLSRNREGLFNLQDLFTEKPGAFKLSLDGLRIQNGFVHFTDRLFDPAGFITSVENLELDINGLSRGDTSRFKVAAKVPDGNGHATLALSGTADIPAAGQSMENTLVDVAFSAKNLNSDRYWPYYGRHLPFERLRGLLDIEQTFKGTLLQFTTKGQLTVRELRFNYPRAFLTPLTPREVRLTTDLLRTPGEVTLKAFELQVDGLKIKGECSLGDLLSKDPHLKARAAIAPFRLAEFNRYIPYGIIPAGTGDFIRQHIKDGLFRLDDGSLEGRLSQIAHMEQGDNANVLFIRAHVDKGVVTIGPQVPAFNSVKGELEMRGKDFSLKGMSGNFGDSPFTLEGKIADYPLATPASYPFTMTINPSKAEIYWLLRQKETDDIAFRGPSLLNLTGAGTLADYRLTGDWDLSRAGYRYQQLLQKPTGIANRIQFAARLDSSAAQLTDFRYQLPRLALTATANYRYNDRSPLSFAASTNRFMVTPGNSFIPALQRYHPAGTLQATISGAGNPDGPEGIHVNGAITLTNFSLRPFEEIKTLSDLNGTIQLTEAALESPQLTGRVGTSTFLLKGRVAGWSKPQAELAFSSPLLHPEDFGFASAGQSPELQDLAGSISLKDGDLKIASLTGQAASTKFRISGDILDNGEPHLNLHADFPFLKVEDLLPLARLQRADTAAKQPGSMALKARITAAEGSFGDTSFRRLAAAMTLSNDQLAVQNLGIDLFGGSVAGSGQVDLGANDGPAYQAHYSLKQIAAAQLLAAAGSQPYLSGKLAAEGDLTARGTTRQELLASARLTANLHLHEGEITARPDAGKPVSYRQLAANLALNGTVLTVQGLKADIFDGSVTGSGRADFAAPGGTGYQAHYTLDRVAADQLLSSLDAEPYCSGLLTAEGEFTAKGDSPDELKNSVRATADLQLTDGLVNTPVITRSKTTNEFPFKKVQARLSLAEKELVVTSLQMNLFKGTVSGNGEADFGAPDGPACRFTGDLADIDAAGLFRALDVTKELSGRMNLQTELKFRGDNAAAIKKSLEGTLALQMEKGTIKKYGFITTVLSILNVSQLVDFRVPDLTLSGMPYDKINSSFTFKDGTVATSDLSIHSSSLNMTVVGSTDIVNREFDLHVGVQPFQTVGKIIGRIPVAGWLLTGGKKRVLVVFYEVKGKWDNPKISTMPMESMSSGVLNIFKRALNLPEEIYKAPGDVFLGN